MTSRKSKFKSKKFNQAAASTNFDQRLKSLRLLLSFFHLGSLEKKSIYGAVVVAVVAAAVAAGAGAAGAVVVAFVATVVVQDFF